MISHTNPSNLLSTLLLPLASRQIQLHSRRQRRVGNVTERVTASVYCEGEVGNTSEVGIRDFEQDTE